ncbi:class I SAM-dependent methyltransferase [Thiothrix nivea]|uniref:Methyltransferase type 11 n=1 Tax=Thiothrix nivea (strain ATCC 35100 / DSM 5205 / JP2) TaxID=870187 RepID=A0A656HL64_THINJ|nr:class I SAM-dependent methyltransferase [Thiothrix nivea]EIJ36982.1 Methyltransferase type 11 [Thiothrix nivea DSM 5205]
MNNIICNNYSALSKYYDAITNTKRRKFLAKEINLIASSIDSSNKNILDIACGTGNLSIELSKYSYNIIAFDNSDSMISIFKEKAINIPNITITNMAMEKFHSDVKIKLAVCTSFSLTYLKNPEKEKFLRSLYNSLIDGGVFVMDMLHPTAIFRYFSNQKTRIIEKSSIETKLESYNENSGVYSVSYIVRKNNDSFTETHDGFVISSQEAINLLKSIGFRKIAYRERESNSDSSAYELFCYK